MEAIAKTLSSDLTFVWIDCDNNRDCQVVSATVLYNKELCLVRFVTNATDFFTKAEEIIVNSLTEEEKLMWISKQQTYEMSWGFGHTVKDGCRDKFGYPNKFSINNFQIATLQIYKMFNNILIQ